MNAKAHRSSRLRALLITAAMVALQASVCPIARGHNGEPPPSPPPRPSAPDAPIAYNIKEAPPPPRWSWIHWWEANRDRYLTTPSQDEHARQADDPKVLAALRDEVAAELARAAEDPGKNGTLAIEAAMALAKMRHPMALPTAKRLIDHSMSVRARPPLLAAIGVLGSAEAEAALLAYQPAREDDEAAAMASLGLLREIQAPALRRIRSAADAVKPAVASTACFALRQHHDKNNAAYYIGLLHGNESPWVAADALLALGRLKDRESVRILEGVLFGDPSAAVDVRAWATLQSLSTNSTRNVYDRSPEEYERRYEAYRGAFERYKRFNPNAKRDPKGLEEKKKVLDGGEIVLGAERLPLGWLRSSAAIALGEIEQPRAGDALLRYLAPRRGEDDPYAEASREFAIMSLAAYPSDASRDRLITLLGKRTADGNKMVVDVTRDSPQRGFAALALGLYARPYDTDQGVADRVGFDRAIVTLAERLEDENEDSEVRTACALGLGLTQRSAVLPILQRATDALHQRGRKQDLLIFGYLLLARALAGDGNVISVTGQFLQGADDTSPSGILARRAGVLALGVSRSSLAIPILADAWNLNFYVNREVIVGLRLAGGTGAAQPLLKRLRESTDIEERAYMAQALGELLAVEQPTSLVRLTARSNYTVHNDKLIPLQRLANVFLYDYLIASFGDEW